VVLYLLNCALFNAFFVQRTLNTNKIKYKNFLHELGRSWISEVQNRGESSSDDLQLPEKQTTPTGPTQDPTGRFSVEFMIHKCEKMFAGGEGNKKYPAKQYKVCAARRSEVKLETFVNFALFGFTKGFVLRNTIQ
jgi:hypothetical protein